MSRKSVPFSAKPASAKHPAPNIAIDAHSDDWVSDRHARPDKTDGPSLLLDLAAERGLTEVFTLSLIAPFALGWFWLVNAMAGRARL